MPNDHDLEKLNKKAQELGDDWEWLPGYYWYQEVVLKTIGDSFDVKPYGQVIVLFVNKKTGETKPYLGKLFKKDG